MTNEMMRLNMMALPLLVVSAVSAAVPADTAKVVAIQSGEIREARVEWWGWNGEDDTVAVQSALDSGARKVIFGKQAGPWTTGPLFVRSDTELVFESGTGLLAKRGAFKGLKEALVTCCGVSNVVLRGLGANAELRMHKADYQSDAYAHGEWRHALNLLSSANVTVEGLRFAESGGDGIYLGVDGTRAPNRDVVIRDCVCDGNHRQGISVISADGLLIERVVLSNTEGTAPKAGIDFEPNGPDEVLRRIVMRDCLSRDNAGSGYEFYLGQLKAKSEAVDITIENCRAQGNLRSTLLSARRTDGEYVGGRVRFVNCTFSDDRDAAIFAYSKGAPSFRVEFDRCVVSNACTASGAADVVCRSDNWRETPPDRFLFSGLKVLQTRRHPWFAYQLPTLAPGSVDDFSGEVSVTDPDGKTERIRLDRSWRTKTFPRRTGPAIPAPHPVDRAIGNHAVAHDAAPGEMADLSPVEVFRRAAYLFLAPGPTTVRFTARQVVDGSGAPRKGAFAVCGPDGKDCGTVPFPGTEAQELSIAVSAKGCYRLYTRDPAARIVLTRASVPVAVDLRDGPVSLRPLDGRTVSLWSRVPDARRFAFAVFAGGGKALEWSVSDAAGRLLKPMERVAADWSMFASEGFAGLVRIDVRQPDGAGFFRADAVGAPAVLFLTDRKTWDVPNEVHVGWWGWNGRDDTVAFQRALDSGARKIVVDREKGPWIALPLWGHSDTELVFEDGAELQAKRGAYLGRRDSLLTFRGSTNIVIRGLGTGGGTLRMHKADYQKPPYEPAEWRYALQLNGVKDVLIENMGFIASGGDGIVLGKNRFRPDGLKWSENVTIRKCVCDDNHRQGISVCAGKNVLIEDTVLKNTSGTAPQSGIDFEPDQWNESISNCVMRNCVSANNAGCGYEFYLGQLNGESMAVDVLIENCRSVGNLHSVLLSSRRSDDSKVKGTMRFRNCAFDDARGSAIHAYSKGADTFRVAFENCTISNACTATGTADVTYAADNWREAPPDGFSFGNLRVVQGRATDWFRYSNPSLSPTKVGDVTGDVTVVAADKSEKKLVLDAAWRAQTFPPQGSTAIPPSRPIVSADNAKAVVHDTTPDGMVDLTKVATRFRVAYLFYADRPKTVRFAGRQIVEGGGAPKTGELLVTSPGGTRYGTVPFLGVESREFAFKVPERGFYRLFTDTPQYAMVLERASVPVAIDFRARASYLRFLDDVPKASFWCAVPDGCPFVVAAFAGNEKRLAWKVTDETRGVECRKELFGPGWRSFAGEESGLYRFDIARPKTDAAQFFRLETTGAPAVLFLSGAKTWSLK